MKQFTDPTRRSQTLILTPKRRVRVMSVLIISSHIVLRWAPPNRFDAISTRRSSITPWMLTRAGSEKT